MKSNETRYLEEQVKLACVAFEQGNEKQAREHLQQARLLLPCCAAVEVAIADVFLQYDKLILAHAYYLEATFREPGNARALRGLKDVESRLAEEIRLRAANLTAQPTLFEEYSM